jgi:hypothetical protein
MDHFNKYHSVNNSVYTSLKSKNQLEGVTDRNNKYGKITIGDDENAKKVIKDYHDNIKNLTSARFSWIVQHIKMFDFDIQHNDRNFAFNRHVSSIFYDVNGVLAGCDRFITTLKPTMLVGFKFVRNESMTFSPVYNVMCVEVNPFWKKEFPATLRLRKIFRRVDEEKLFQATYNVDTNTITPTGTNEKLNISPVYANKDRTETNTSICALCKMRSYDSNYFAINLFKLKNGFVICPLCMHLSTDEIDKLFSHVFVFKHPRRINDIIDTHPGSDVKRSIMKECSLEIMKGISLLRQKTINISNKYLAVTKVQDYLLDNNSVNNTKEIFTVTNLEAFISDIGCIDNNTSCLKFETGPEDNVEEAKDNLSDDDGDKIVDDDDENSDDE